MKVVHFERANVGGKSIERLFEVVRAALPKELEVVRQVCPHPTKGLLAVWRNGLWARKHQGDVNHVVGDVHYLVPFLKWKRTVLTIHDLRYLDDERRPIHKLAMLLLWTWLPVTCARTTTVISPFTRDRLLAYVPWARKKIVVIPNCLTIEGSPREPIREPLSKPILLHIGTTPNKNLEATIEALRGFSCLLRVVGRLSDAQRAQLEASGVEHELHVDVSHEELLRLYRTSDLLLYLTRYEGFGLPILEAQACGVPVITSDLDVTRFAGGDGCAYLGLPVDGADVRATIAQIVSGRTEYAGAQSRGAQNAARFLPARVATAYHRVYSGEGVAAVDGVQGAGSEQGSSLGGIR